MKHRFRELSIAAATAAVTVLVMTLAMTRTEGQAARPARLPDGKPNFTGIWQALNEAHWDLEAHAARPGSVMQPGVYPDVQVAAAPVMALGAAAGVPGSVGVVDGDGAIPYKPEALKIKQENAAHWIDRDPELKCFLPGLPRATYMPYPFQITQSTNKIQMAYEFSNAARTIHLDEVDPPPDESFMGHSLGHWEGDTLVVNVSDLNDQTWFDRAGNYHSNQMKLVERYTQISPDALKYEATITDPDVFTKPWTISMPLYRRLEANAQLIEYRCVEFVEEFMFGHLRKQQLVKHWEGDTISIDITRKVPEGDKLYNGSGLGSDDNNQVGGSMAVKAAGVVAGVGLMLLGAGAGLSAHHAFAAEFDANKPIKFTGSVTKMEWTNPHTWLYLDVKMPNGKVENWAIEAGTPNVLFRRGFTRASLMPGTVIAVDGYQAKDGSHRANGRNLTLPDGKMLFLGSSGTGAPYELTPENQRK